MPDSNTDLAPKYKRVLLKLSGESLGHGGKSGISPDETKAVAEQLARVHARGEDATRHPQLTTRCRLRRKRKARWNRSGSTVLRPKSEGTRS